MKKILITVFIFALLPVAVNAQTLPPNETVGTSWYGNGCEVARVTSCNVSSDVEVLIYANGIRVGVCGSGSYSQFYSRGLYTDSITLVNTSYTSSTQLSGLSIECETGFSGQSQQIDPTATPILVTPQPIPDFSGQSSGDSNPIPMPSFGGDLSDPNSPVNLWLGYAQDTIDMVNHGNLLYIIGAIAGAGAVMVWAIQQVKNPRSW